MILPGHLAGGYLTGYAILKLANVEINPEQVNTLLIMGTLAGELPDVDIAIFAISSLFKKDKSRPQKNNHREYMTHAPLFWVALCSIISVTGYLSDSIFLTYSGIIILAGVLSHFILDSIEYGIRWLWPLSNKRFSLIRSVNEEKSGDPASLDYYWNFIRNTYIRRLSFYIEIAITVFAIYIFLT